MGSDPETYPEEATFRFQFALADRLHMTVGELRHGRGTPMSHREFVLWMAYMSVVAFEQKGR